MLPHTSGPTVVEDRNVPRKYSLESRRKGHLNRRSAGVLSRKRTPYSQYRVSHCSAEQAPQSKVRLPLRKIGIMNGRVSDGKKGGTNHLAIRWKRGRWS